MYIYIYIYIERERSYCLSAPSSFQGRDFVGAERIPCLNHVNCNVGVYPLVGCFNISVVSFDISKTCAGFRTPYEHIPGMQTSES